MSKFGALPNTSKVASTFVPTTGNFSNDDDKEKFCVFSERYRIYIDLFTGNPGFRPWFTYNAHYGEHIFCKDAEEDEPLGDPKVSTRDGTWGQPGQKVSILWDQIKTCDPCTQDPELGEYDDRYTCVINATQAYKGGSYDSLMKEIWVLAGGGQPKGSPIDLKLLKKKLKLFASHEGCRPDLRCEIVNKKCKKKKKKL